METGSVYIWSGRSKLLHRYHRSNIDYVVERLLIKTGQIIGKLKKLPKNALKTDKIFFKVLVSRPMVHISQSKLSVCQKYPKDDAKFF